MFRWTRCIDDYIPACVRMLLELQGGKLPSLIEDYRLIPDESRHELCMKFSIIASYYIHFIRIKTYLPIFGRKIVTAGYGFLKLAKFNNFGVVPSKEKRILLSKVPRKTGRIKTEKRKRTSRVICSLIVEATTNSVIDLRSVIVAPVQDKLRKSTKQITSMLFINNQQ